MRECQVGEGEVEMWAIKAMECGLMDGKLDQLDRRLLVNHCPPRLVSSKDWSAMCGKLVGWRDRIKELQAVVQATRARHLHDVAMMQTQVAAPMH